MATVTATLRERFEAKVDRSPNDSGCWLWTGALGPNGYARIRAGGKDEPTLMAHRVAYELYVGPIPEGFTIDHVKKRGCVHRHCMNPAHLEPVTRGENSLRGDSPSVRAWRSGRCARGHDLSTAWRKPNGHVAQCRECWNERKARA